MYSRFQYVTRQIFVPTSAAENHEINRIGNMPIFSISGNNESLHLNCRAKKMYKIVNNQMKFLTSQYIGTCKSAYTKGYALN
mgnify:CR=1 FL=1